MMKIINCFVLILFAATAQGRIVFISDVDDTIKEANVLSKTDRVVRGPQTSPDMSFHGMAELYRSIAKEHKDIDINYISNAPKVPMEVFHSKFLNESKYPQARNLFTREGDESDHKEMQITEIINSIEPTEVILIGDNAERDSEIYAEIVDRYPDTEFHVYMRLTHPQSKGASGLSDGQIPFVTSADLALNMFKANLVSWSAANEILLMNTTKKGLRDVFKSPGDLLRLPDFVDCREYVIDPDWLTSQNKDVQNLLTGINERCR